MQNTYLKKAIKLALVMCATSMAAKQVSAEVGNVTSEAPSADGQATTLGEIVVTASKRPETLQTSPQSVSVITQEQLQSAGAFSVTDLSKIAPDLNFSQRGASTLIEMRGVSSRGYDERSDPAISISVDGVYLKRSTTLDASLFDVDRVEVLRGPQGVLYGRDAVGGAINIISAAPVQDFEGSGALSAGNYSDQRAEGMVNMPLSDTLAVRLAVLHEQHNGYRDNYPAGSGDDEDESAVRASTKWTPSDNFTGTFIGEYVRNQGVGPVRLGVPMKFDAAGYLIDQSTSSLIASDSRWPLDHTGATDLSVASGRWSGIYDFGPASLGYYGGYSHSHIYRDEDYDGNVVPASSQLGFPQDSSINTQSHEFRITSNGPTAFTYQAGAYFFEEHEALYATFTRPYNGQYLPEYVYDYVSEPGYGVISKSVGGFGQVGYQVLDSLKVEAGIRYSSDNKHQVGSENTLSYNPDNSIASVVYTKENLRSSSSQPTYHVGLQDQLTTNSMVYAKFDTSYKAGGFTEVNSFGPETISAYEVGSKNRLFGNKVQLNGSAFYYDYKDQQIQEFIGNKITTVNAGKTEIYGVEVEGLADFTSADRGNFSLSWLHARFVDFIYNTTLIPSNLGNNNVQLGGYTPIQSPTWTITAGYEHDFFVAGSRVNARIQTQFETSSYLSVLDLAGGEQHAYTRSDFVLTVYPKLSHYYVQAYVHNLENSQILTEGEPNGYTGNWFFQFAPPRTYGMRIAFNF